MALLNYKEKYHVYAEVLYAVICIHQAPSIERDRSPVNQMLENVQKMLQKELEHYREVYLAIVYDEDGLQVKSFKKLEKGNMIYYRGRQAEDEGGSFSRLWLMGMALLEQAQKKAGREVQEKKLILITDSSLPRAEISRVVAKDSQEIQMHPRFKELNFNPVIYKTADADCDYLENYVPASSIAVYAEKY